MTFKVIDTKTGKEPTRRVVQNIKNKVAERTMDIDQFFVGQDGALALLDEYGRIISVDMERFEVEMNEAKLRAEIASEVREKMYQMCVCLNVQESVLNIILDNNQPFESHCHRDCKNTTCDLWGKE